MKIKLLSLEEGARQASGLVVIIDVFRAFTVEAAAFSHGVEKIILTDSASQAIQWRYQGYGDFVIGEVNGEKPDDFDFPNSPRPFIDHKFDFFGKTLIHRSSSGTSGVCWAESNAKALYAASFNISEATIKAIIKNQPDLVSIVAMGAGGQTRTDEDELCASYLRSRLENRQPDIESIKSLIRSGNTYHKYNGLKDHNYRGDTEVALNFNKYDFAIRIKKEAGFIVARPEFPS